MTLITFKVANMYIFGPFLVHMRAHQSRFQLKLSRHVRLFKNALWHIPFGGNESSFFLNRQVCGFWPCSMPGVVARSGQTQRRTSKIIGELRGAPHADPAQGALAPPAPPAPVSACHGARGVGGRLRGALAEQAPPARAPRWGEIDDTIDLITG